MADSAKTDRELLDTPTGYVNEREMAVKCELYRRLIVVRAEAVVLREERDMYRDAGVLFERWCDCPGIEIDDCSTSGCDAQITGSTDCPTCGPFRRLANAALAALTPKTEEKP